MVFKLSSKGKTVLFSFNGTDGANPAAGLILDAKGNLYGTTYAGGASGHGVVFKLSSKGRRPYSSPSMGRTGRIRLQV